MNSLKTNAFNLLTLLAMIGLSIYFYPQLPAEVATRFDWNGQPIQYSPKEQQAVMMPGVFLLLLILVNALVRISPKKYSMPNTKRSIDSMNFAVGLMLLFIHLGMLLDPSGAEFGGVFPSWGMVALLIVMGNAFGKTERNFFLGIRTPWTIASGKNWTATHRFAGKLMVGLGLVLALVTVFAPSFIVAISFLIASRLVPIFYSYRFYLRQEKPLESTEDLDAGGD
ncbi:MAG: SdpI family protein [Pseudohongiellaceae bacterium]|nr:SdpI family protein [Pseudohongiellaceae bacterium]